jgi:hypothetical protein
MALNHLSPLSPDSDGGYIKMLSSTTFKELIKLEKDAFFQKK